jgi:uncharacterized protein (DUF2267 family)
MKRDTERRPLLAVCVLALLVLGWLSQRRTPAGRVVRRSLRAGRRRARYAAGRVHGLLYRWSRRHPDPDVPDQVLAERVRALLGPVLKRLDLPRVRITVREHVVAVHGDVSTPLDAVTIERAVWAVPGVRGVISLLHDGLLPGDSRPSEGSGARPVSAALRRLLTAARESGCDDETALPAVRAVLSTFFGQLPPATRRSLDSHLPVDVRVLALPVARHGATQHVHTADALVDMVLALDHLDAARGPAVVSSVLHALRQLVPQDARAVDAALPADLRPAWTGAGETGASRTLSTSGR